MVNARDERDPNLLKWDEIKERHDWSALLVGNGASQAVWSRFGYVSLYDAALKADLEHSLHEADQSLFEAMHTRNFEAVLGALAVARMVGLALGQPVETISERYESVRKALVSAVHAVHVPWLQLPDETMKRIRNELLKYQFIFSTNYDLLIYWSIMHNDGGGFKDYFWGEKFDVSDVEIWGNFTRVLYLHGGLHLYRLPYGTTFKRPSEFGMNLLDLFGEPYKDGALPLFISEGTSEDKLRSIYSSDYLSFSFARFARHKRPVVVFGHGLGDSDTHIVAAMKAWGQRSIAISVLPGDDDEVVARKAFFRHILPQANLYLFDASTHPLGGPNLRVEDDKHDVA